MYDKIHPKKKKKQPAAWFSIVLKYNYLFDQSEKLVNI